MSNKKQTAVEWLTDQLGIDGGTMRDNALAIERVELIRINKLETLAKLLAKSWFYGKWEWETPNERIMQMLMQELGYYPFKNEDEMIHHTRVDEDLYKKAVDKVALINPRIIPVENHTVDTNEMIDHIGNTNKMVKKTAMQQLLLQLKEKRSKLPLPIEWDRAYQSIEMMIKNTYLPMEREQIEDAYWEGFEASGEGWNGEYGLKDMRNICEEIKAEQYYEQTYGGKNEK
jgi:hypothetical protein